MALDRFVYWKTERRPTRDNLQMVLEDYVRDLGTVNWEQGRFFVTLLGVPSWPFARVPEADNNHCRVKEEDKTEDDGTPRPRWFEVYVSQDNIDVITRSADEITNNIAKGFAELCARFWRGELET